MKKTKIPKNFYAVSDGEWIKPKRRGYLIQCCDCGLIHRMNFKLIKIGRGKAVIFQAFRVDKPKKRKSK